MQTYPRDVGDSQSRTQYPSNGFEGSQPPPTGSSTSMSPSSLQILIPLSQLRECPLPPPSENPTFKVKQVQFPSGSMYVKLFWQPSPPWASGYVRTFGPWTPEIPHDPPSPVAVYATEPAYLALVSLVRQQLLQQRQSQAPDAAGARAGCGSRLQQHLRPQQQSQVPNDANARAIHRAAQRQQHSRQHYGSSEVPNAAEASANDNSVLLDLELRVGNSAKGQ